MGKGLHVRILPLLAQFIVMYIKVVIGTLTVTPSELAVTVGNNVRFQCHTDSKEPIDWKYGKEQNSFLDDIYMGQNGLVGDYKKSERHRVENPANGQYDLIIGHITGADDGFYVCVETDGSDTRSVARLTVAGYETFEESCQYQIFATLNDIAELKFSECILGPYRLGHIAMGRTSPKTVFDGGRLVDDYAKSGRFTVDSSSGICELRINQITTSDAGIYVCSEEFGSGDSHKIDFIVLDTIPKCSGDISNCTTPMTVEIKCKVNFTGNCDPKFVLWKEIINGSQCINDKHPITSGQMNGSVESKITAILETETNFFCQIENPTVYGKSGCTTPWAVNMPTPFQCNTSLDLTQCLVTYAPVKNFSNMIFMYIILFIAVFLNLAAGVAVFVWCIQKKERSESKMEQ